MKLKIVAIFGLVAFAMGLFIIAVPASLAEMAQVVLNPVGVVFAGSIRVVLGIILWLAADGSRTPRTFKVLGILIVIGGITVFAIGVPGLTSVVEWGTLRGDLVIRGAGLFALCLGGFLAWSAMPPKGAE